MMKKFRLIAAILLLVILTLSLAACDMKHIKDTNGDDDFSLVTITDEDILGKDKYFALGATNKPNGNGYTVSMIGKFSGVWRVAVLSVSGVGYRTINTDMYVESGNCRLVLVYNDEIVYDFNIRGQDSYRIYSSGSSTQNYYLKLAGESAKIGTFDFTW